MGGGWTGRGGASGHGGRCINCACPCWRPGIARRVEFGAVESARRPETSDEVSKPSIQVSHGGDISPRSFTEVSYSPYRVMTPSSILNTTTRLLRATAIHSRLDASPRTRSRNSSSATSCPRASSQTTTLFGGYRGLRRPPTRSNKEDVCIGWMMANAPLDTSSSIRVHRSQKTMSLYCEQRRAGDCGSIFRLTTLAQESQRPGTIDRKPIRCRDCKYLDVLVESDVDEVEWPSGLDGVPNVHCSVLAPNETSRQIHERLATE